MKTTNSDITILENPTKNEFDDLRKKTNKPILIHGIIKESSIFNSKKDSNETTINTLKNNYNKKKPPIVYMESNNERFFYLDDMSGFNFSLKKSTFDHFINSLTHPKNQKSLYCGSLDSEQYFPDLGKKIKHEILPKNVYPRVWIGGKTTVAAHYDIPSNIAVVLSGQRTFTLFPPEQISNLYIGPLDFTPAGQSISLVDFENPDLEKYPNFSIALENSISVTLNSGEAIYIPSMWWHHVKSKSKFNVLLNYWWNDTPDYYESPIKALIFSLISIKPLPEQQKKAWKKIFNHYIFDDHQNNNVAHIPSKKLGILGQLTKEHILKIKSKFYKQ